METMEKEVKVEKSGMVDTGSNISLPQQQQ
jgi:hypothetical protein